MKERCANCACFVPNIDYQPVEEDEVLLGQCRAEPPKMNISESGDDKSGIWPRVPSNKWCMCHTPKDD